MGWKVYCFSRNARASASFFAALFWARSYSDTPGAGDNVDDELLEEAEWEAGVVAPGS